MFKLFRIEDTTAQPIQIAPEWNYIKTNTWINLQRVKQYYRNSAIAVSSQHFIVRLLQSIPVPKHLDLDTYYKTVNDIALSHSSSMQMTSPYYRGKFFTGVAYGKQSMECLLVVDDMFHYQHVHDNWEDVISIKPIMHDKSDLSLLVPNGIDYSNELSNSVLLINLPMLAVQYRAFYLAKTNNPRITTNKTIMHFVAQYVLPNMLPDHLDLCLINRLMNRYYEKDKTITFNTRHPFALVNLEDQIDTVINKILGYIKTSPKRFDLILKTIPSFVNQNAYKSLLMPDIATTKQVHWAGMWARLKYMAFLCDMCDERSLHTNQSEVNEIALELNYGDLYNTFRNNLPVDLFFKAQSYVDTITDSFSDPFYIKH
jgi:hypothetical protein